MSISVELIMTDALQQKVQALARLANDAEALNTALIAAGWLVANDAKARAPYKSGTLRRSIDVASVGPGDVRVGSSVPYAARIEFGFVGADSAGRNYHQAAQPYLRPAFEENQAAVRQAVIDGALELIRGIAA